MPVSYDNEARHLFIHLNVIYISYSAGCLWIAFCTEVGGPPLWCVQGQHGAQAGLILEGAGAGDLPETTIEETHGTSSSFKVLAQGGHVWGVQRVRITVQESGKASQSRS